MRAGLAEHELVRTKELGVSGLEKSLRWKRATRGSDRARAFLTANAKSHAQRGFV